MTSSDDETVSGSGEPGLDLGLLARMDIYLIDQLLRQRLSPTDRVLDAGCGAGRNIAYLLRRGGSVWGIDSNPEAIAEVRRLATALGVESVEEHFLEEPVESTSFGDACFDFVISNAVLHFAEDVLHFDRMVAEMWRVLAPGGLFFARLATSIGLDDGLRARGGGWFDLPDGSSRFLVDEAKLLETTERLGGTLADPIKTTLVQNLRSMTTWVLWKPEGERGVELQSPDLP